MMMLMLSYSKSWCQISILHTGGQTDSVLISIDYIKLANIVEDDDLEGTELEVLIKAYGIQTLNVNDEKDNIDGINSDGKNSPNDVWKILSNQRVLT